MMTKSTRCHEYLFDNGFKLIIKEDHRSPIAILQIFYKVGSSYEHNGITGISHILEHMMFRGTKKYNAKEFLDTIAAYGGIQQAHTGHDYTTYSELIEIKYLVDCIKFEADRMHNLLLRKQDFLNELEIVIEERCLSVEDQPHRRVHELFIANSHVSSPYRHPIIGWMNDLHNTKIEDVIHWYQTWYVPNNAIMVIIGDVNPEQISKLVNRYFNVIKPSNLPLLKPQIELAPIGIRTININIESQLPWLLIGYNVPSLCTVTIKWEVYALLLLCELLAGDESAILSRKIIQNRHLATELSFDYSPFSRLPKVLTIMATPFDIKSMDIIIPIIIKQINTLHHTIVNEDELNRIKIRFHACNIYEKDSITGQANDIGSFEAIGLSWKEIDKAYQIISTITPSQIQQVAQKYLTEDRLTMAKLIPKNLKGL
jgi:zinc protease